jgi:hypothetical protein
MMHHRVPIIVVFTTATRSLFPGKQTEELHSRRQHLLCLSRERRLASRVSHLASIVSTKEFFRAKGSVHWYPGKTIPSSI